jgi:Domain of unknown function (DUF4224)
MIVLSEQELVELTEKTRPSAQARVLDFMGIFYRPRPDGSLAVLRIHVETPAEYPAKLGRPEPVLQP